MRKIYFLLLTFLTVQCAHAQHVGKYGNEWIDYTPGHQYWKVRASVDGCYRIPYSTLSSTIPNLSSINPADFVMFHNGVTIPINVSTSGATMDSNSYIEFIGKKNIGDVDSFLYPKPGNQPHTLYSLFTDTSVYFLTTRPGGNNFHYQIVANDTAAIPTLTEDMYWWFTNTSAYGASNAKFSNGTPFLNGTDYLYKSLYDNNEGWGGGWINYTNSPQAPSLFASLVYTVGPQYCVFKGRLFTRSYERHNITITLNGHLVDTFAFDNANGGFSDHPFSDTLPLSDLVTNSSSQVTSYAETFSSQNLAENLLMYQSLATPHKFDFNANAQLLFPLMAGNGRRFFRISNVPVTTTQPLIYDITNGYIVRSTEPPAVLPKKFILPAAVGERELFYRSDAASTMRVLTRMDTVTFQDYSQQAVQCNYMIITHNVLRKDSVGHDYVQDYANYRDIGLSPTTGKYKTHIFDIDQIIDQFGYGVRKTPLATRNFIEFAYDHWTSKKPDYLFLIGKGRSYVEMRNSSYAYDQDLITPFGSSPSDILLACRRNSNIPLMAVGRLAAQTPADVRNYLAKVRQYELLQNTFGDPHQTKSEKLWMKQIMHFSGGSGDGEQQQFASYLSDFANIAKDTSWGANTFTIYKTSSQPVDNSQAEIIRAHIDSGVSLMTFFGHAAGSTFDISVDDPRNWTNYDKYPMIYSNGCQSGDLSSVATVTIPPIPSFSELSVLVPGKCAVAFTATSNLSTSTELYEYGTYQYQTACQNAYDQPWGKALQKTQILMDQNLGGDDFAMLVAYEMTLHGDPALLLNQYSKPDYQIDQSSLYFNPSIVDARTDSFTVNIIVANLGKAIKDSIQISLTRKYSNPNNPIATLSKVYTWKVKAPYYIDTISIKVPTFLGLDSGYGQNQFSVYVENEHRIAELSETNNGDNIQFGLAIQSDDILPVYPYEFAIVPTQNVTLKASTVNPFAAPKNYKIQIDTSELFRHPLAQANIYQAGGVLHWTVPFTFHDSTVYYWRVSRDSINDSTAYRWHYSSFVYIQNEYPGWNQSHYYQYGHDSYNDNIYLANDRVFKFVKNVNSIHVTTGWADATSPHGPVPAANIQYDINTIGASGTQHRFVTGGCGYASPATGGGFTFAVIDTLTGLPWVTQPDPIDPRIGTNGEILCGRTLNGFDYRLDLAVYNWPVLIKKFLDSIPNGHIVVMYSVNLPDWTHLDTSLVNKLVGYGATGLRQLTTGAHPAAPYIFFFMKGNPAIKSEVIGRDYTSGNGITEAFFNYGTLWNKGSFQSPLIGPSTDWGSFHWRHRPRENPTTDQQAVDIIGVSNNGLPTNLLTTTAPDTVINFISATQYPYIRLRLHSEDDTTHTPTQLYYWRVLYKKVPEAAINPAAHFVTSHDTLGLGDMLNVEVALENVTDLPMDSIRTLYTLQKIGGPPTNTIVKSDSLRAGQTQILKFSQVMNNSALAGKDRVIIEANPNDALHQLEQYHFNNYATYDFSSTSDKINPLLDVTFDGRRIMNNDLVSAKPDVLITMKDENKTLALNDTSLAQVYIRYPGQVVPTLINYDNNTLTFYPATGNIAKRNQARIEFKPAFTMDGTYDLLVRDKDKSGNYSSNSNNKYAGTPINGIYYDYKISFNVITKSMITNVLNYPNPFTTRTQFVFTLTGSEVPDYMKIQIMTITGKVVKEIQRAELGNIHVGVNKTDYYWDGRDEYGDKLANGVYFYRVITKIDDKNVDHMNSAQYGQFFNNTNIDKYFKHGFGKLVIMR